MKIFDLNFPSIQFTNNLHKNVLLLKKRFGVNFIIKDGEFELPSHLYIVTEPDNPKIQYYSLIYNLKERDDWLLPYKIVFYDTQKIAKNNNCYIANIHKTDKISGTNMVNIVLKLLKLLGAEKVRLHDGAHIICQPSGKDIDLSFFKLLEKGITFYQKFGFKFTIDPNNTNDLMSYGSTANMIKVMQKTLNDINKIKLSYYKDAYIKVLDIINKAIKNQDYENVKIYLHHPYKPYLVKKDKVKEHLLTTLPNIDTLLSIIKLSEKKYLTETMIELFYSDCNTYLQLEDIIFNNQFMGISYKGKGIYLKHNMIFRTLRHIRNNATFEIELN